MKYYLERTPQKKQVKKDVEDDPSAANVARRGDKNNCGFIAFLLEVHSSEEWSLRNGWMLRTRVEEMLKVVTQRDNKKRT